MISFRTLQEGPSFFNIVLQPYAEAVNHFFKAFSPSAGISLLGRVSHIGKGLLLIIPVINSIFMLVIFLSFHDGYTQRTVLFEELSELKQSCPSELNRDELVDYFCPTNLFTERPNIDDNLAQIQIATLPSDPKGVDQEKTYRLMLLCEALYINFDSDEKTYDDILSTFKRLGYWGYGDGSNYLMHQELVNILGPRFLDALTRSSSY